MVLSFIFGADRIPWSEVNNVKDSAPEIIIWAIPVIFVSVLVEIYFSYRQNKKYYDKKESLGSLAIGVGNILISTWIKVLLFYMAVWIYNVVPWRMEFEWWTLIPCYIIFDFCSYWAHNISHRQRFWWATHVAHHSGEHYNLTVAFRLSWVQYLKIIFLFPIPLLGFHPIVFFVANQIAILFQFWVHTEYIGKLPRIIEYVFATPSNHRVHHGSQEMYINKNYGATFILWDRMFGTFQEETERPVYGLTDNIKKKSDPFHINFHEYVEMFKDVSRSKTWRDRLFFVFGNPLDIAKRKKKLRQAGRCAEPLASSS